MDESAVVEALRKALESIKQECERKGAEELYRDQTVRLVQSVSSYIEDQTTTICRDISVHYLRSKLKEIEEMCASTDIDIRYFVDMVPVKLIESISSRSIISDSCLYTSMVYSLLRSRQLELIYDRNAVLMNCRELISQYGLNCSVTVNESLPLFRQYNDQVSKLSLIQRRCASIQYIKKQFLTTLSSLFEQWHMDFSLCQYFMKNLSTQHDQIDFLCDLLNANTTPDKFFREYCFRLKLLIDSWIPELDLKAISSSYSTLFSDVTKLSLQDTKRIESFLATLKETMETAIAERAKQVIQNVQRERQALFGGYFARRYQLLLSKSVFSLSELHELNMIYSTLQNHSHDYQELYSLLADRDEHLDPLLAADERVLSDEEMYQSLQSLIDCDNKIIHMFNSIQTNCFDDSLPYLPNLRFLCPIVFSSPFATLVRE
ncbi:hypothetical protein WA538_000078, partial [Blastocystis sp. DL]